MPAAQSPPHAEPETIARPAVLEKVGQHTGETILSYPAVIEGQEGAELAFSVNGVVKEMNVRAAQVVEKGQILAKLDQRDYRSRVESAHASYQNARKEYQRAHQLLEKNVISRSETEKRKTAMETAKANWDTAKKALEDTIIVAPFSGRVATVAIETLQTVTAGQPAIRLLTTDRLDAIISLPSHFIAVSKKKEKHEFSISIEAAPDVRIPAEFKEISLEADPASQTYEMRLSFTPPRDIVVLPGMNAVVWIKAGGQIDDAQGVSVPLTAVGTEHGNKFVWVVDTDKMTVSKRRVTIADHVGERLPVFSGLTKGETIVSKGISSLSEGMKVRQWSKE